MGLNCLHSSCTAPPHLERRVLFVEHELIHVRRLHVPRSVGLVVRSLARGVTRLVACTVHGDGTGAVRGVVHQPVFVVIRPARVGVVAHSRGASLDWSRGPHSLPGGCRLIGHTTTGRAAKMNDASAKLPQLPYRLVVAHPARVPVAAERVRRPRQRLVQVIVLHVVVYLLLRRVCCSCVVLGGGERGEGGALSKIGEEKIGLSRTVAVW
jgi:hypothetical protein